MEEVVNQLGFFYRYLQNRHPREGGGVISHNVRNDEPGTGL